MDGSAAKIATPARSDLRFLPVALESLDFCALEMDLYLKTRSGAPEPTLYRAAGVEFTPQDAARLAEQGVKFVHISVAHHAAYRRMLQQKLEAKVRDPKVRHQERWKAVRASCDQMIHDVLLLPGQTEAVEAVGDISRAFAEWSGDESLGFSYMLDMSAHDFYTTSHMVNVGVGCGLLIKALVPDDPALFSVVVQGGMLHDIGKRGVPEEILNKEGKLDPDEWAQIQKHPELGFAELKQHPILAPVVPQMARDHHERVDGKGYPRGISGDLFSLPARVCAVVDVYDAITAARPYRGPIAPADAIKMMAEGRGTQFDADIFDAWSELVQKLIKEDEARAPNRSAPGAVSSRREAGGLTVAVTSGPVGSDAPVDASVGDRRRHERVKYTTRIKAAFIRQGKRLPVPVGEAFDVDGIDLSRSGIGLCTRWPCSIGDILWVQLGAKGGQVVKRHVMVVRVRRAEGGWLAGCRFIEEQEIPR